MQHMRLGSVSPDSSGSEKDVLTQAALSMVSKFDARVDAFPVALSHRNTAVQGGSGNLRVSYIPD
eukprot:1262509-Pleurochrysis_carterae.AAC.1